MKFLIIYLVLIANTAYASTWLDDVSHKVELAANLKCGSYPNIENLQTQFDCENALLEVSNALYNGWLKSDKVKRKDSLYLLWNQGSIDSKSSNSVLANPTVRLNVAALIGQLNKMTSLNLNIETQRSYARKYINDMNTMFVLDAITALGWLGTETDLDTLLKIVNEEKEGLAETAVLGIINLLDGHHKTTLSKLNDSVERKSLRAFIANNL